MKHSIALWTSAFIVTVVSAYYQRVTGPSYPLVGSTHFKDETIDYSLPRSHGGVLPADIKIQLSDSAFHGYVEWKRYKTEDDWTRTAFSPSMGGISAELPSQPKAGKLQYRVILYRGDEVAVIPADGPLVMRFKGDVPLVALIPHIVAMFAAMLLASRTGLEYFNGRANLGRLTNWTIGFLAFGGFVLGPIVQYYAFDAWWTGWPLGTDLTDNKTAIALLAWIVVAIAQKKTKNPRAWALAASIITFAIFLIPHSVFGSELDYRSLDKQKTKVDTVMPR